MEDGKIGRIHEIWKEGKGVVVLQVFHQTSNREAHTREEAMISALGLKNLSNSIHGSWHGPEKRLCQGCGSQEVDAKDRLSTISDIQDQKKDFVNNVGGKRWFRLPPWESVNLRRPRMPREAKVGGGRCRGRRRGNVHNYIVHIGKNLLLGTAPNDTYVPKIR